MKTDNKGWFDLKYKISKRYFWSEYQCIDVIEV